MAAKEAIAEALEDITTVDTLTIPVPAQYVNQVINDSALRQLQDQTGLTANVAKSDDGTGIRLTGLAGAIEEARKLIERLNEGEGAGFLPLQPGLFTRMAPRQHAELQNDLRFLMQNTGALIEIGEGANRADIQGGQEEVWHAKAELQKILKFYFPQECDVIELPPESVDWMAGEDDRQLMRLQSAGCVAALDRSGCTMWLCGNPKGVEATRRRVQNSLQRWDREHFTIDIPEGTAGRIIGSGGATIRELQSSTGARIDIDADRNRVIISGKEESVREAKGKILGIV